MMLAPMLRSTQLEYSPLCIYRDAIRRVSVSSRLCRSVQFFLPINGDAVSVAGEESYRCWSSGSSSSGSSLNAWGSGSPLYLSSSDGDSFFSGRWHAAPDEELRAIALQMVHDGYMKRLIQAFSSVVGSSSDHYNLARNEVLLTSWFSELDVDWLWDLHTGEDGDMMRQLVEDGCVSLQDFKEESILPLKTLIRVFTLQDLMETWIRALKTMVQVLCITQVEISAKASTVGGVRNAIRYFLIAFAAGKQTKYQQEVVQFTQFAEASIVRMLAFVDAVVDAALNDHLAPEMLPGMLLVYACILDDLPAVLAVFKETSSTPSKSKFDGMNRVFVQKRERLSDAIWSMMEKVRVSFLIHESWHVSSGEVQGVHKSTKLMMNYIMLMSRNEGALNFVLQDQHRVRMCLPQRSLPKLGCRPHQGYDLMLGEASRDPSSVVDLIKDTISCLEKQVEKASYSISDPGLRYIFLMNNFIFISQKVSSLLLPSWTRTEDDKIHSNSMCTSMKRDTRARIPSMEDYINHPDPNLPQKIETDSNLDGLVQIQKYIEAYLDASWDPVLSCLYLPYGVHGYRGALAKFESEFQRTHALQKLWKVPNPELRKRLRKAVIEKVISGYSVYLAEREATGKRNRSILGPNPHELEELLEELFEG